MSGGKQPKLSLRITATKRGTTIRASGAAAQALFDALTAGVDKDDKAANKNATGGEKERVAAIAKATGSAS